MEQRADIQSLLSSSASSIGINMTADQVSKFMIYLKQLKEWNKTTNLTSIVKDEEVVIKHFIDSIAAIKAENFIDGSLIFDIGSGAGFPGIPIKILRPDLRLVLVEPSKKKSSFLRYIIGLLKLRDVDIFEGSLEQFADNFINHEQANYIVARGIKFEFIIDLSRTILTSKGRILLFLSTLVDRSRLAPKTIVENEYSFDLPIGYGTRVVTSLSLSS
ncbi:MAG: 16S rRNA (guanine(527)-N(7))-methyltransferase RsmG [Nitrospirota bacterium]